MSILMIINHLIVEWKQYRINDEHNLMAFSPKKFHSNWLSNLIIGSRSNWNSIIFFFHFSRLAKWYESKTLALAWLIYDEVRLTLWSCFERIFFFFIESQTQIILNCNSCMKSGVNRKKCNNIMRKNDRN